MKMDITIHAIWPEEPGLPGAYAAICRERGSDAWSAAEGASFSTSRERMTREITSLLSHEVIRPAMGDFEDNPYVNINTEDDPLARTLLSYNQFACSGHMGATLGLRESEPDSHLARQLAVEALDASTRSGVEWNSMSLPEASKA